MYKDIKKRLIKLIPFELRQRAVDIKNNLWGGYKQIHYSHCGEDIVIEKYFRVRQKKNGFYVDVGAHHPKRYSNTALLYEQGWHGINIDPDPYLAKQLQKNRHRDKTLNIGVAQTEGEMVLHKFSDPAVNTFSDENAERLKQRHWLRHIGDEKISVLQLKTVLEKHLPQEQIIDFLNVDVEDLDIDVLRSNDWQKYRPHLVAVEDRLFDITKPSESAVYAFMIDQNYLFLGYVGLTLLFVDKHQAANSVHTN